MEAGREKGVRCAGGKTGNLKEQPHSAPSAKVASEVSQVAMSVKPQGSAQAVDPATGVWVAGEPRGGPGMARAGESLPVVGKPTALQLNICPQCYVAMDIFVQLL